MDDSRLLDLARPLIWMIAALTRNLDARAERCAADVAELAVRLDLTADAAEQAVVAAWLHDLGMAMLPQMLAIPGPFTTESRREMQRHPELGAAVVAELRRHYEDHGRAATGEQCPCCGKLRIVSGRWAGPGQFVGSHSVGSLNDPAERLAAARERRHAPQEPDETP